MQGINLAEQGHFVNVIPPKNITGGAVGDRFHLKNNGHATILVQVGVSAAAFTKILVRAADAATAGNTTDIAFNVYKEETALGDTLGTKTAVAATGLTPDAADNIMYVIEIDATELPAGKPWIEVELDNVSARSVLASCAAILTGARYQGDPANTATAIV